jgi:hypothetical protein
MLSPYWGTITMSYRKIGGLHHIRIGRFGFVFYWKVKS